ncbi:MAG: hypothetical protein KatS3mg003_0026 [Candidatus Nitrosocaldaceae archaeon]|nr:MAG: hypothetical protein KatS3mg003_0026 [Candidatus Nitrosocaldaceae archaeon]
MYKHYIRCWRCYVTSDRGFGGFRPKPVEKDKEYNVKIEEISKKGDGIARIEGFVIFVKDAQVGQECQIRISHVGNRFATADIVS